MIHSLGKVDDPAGHLARMLRMDGPRGFSLSFAHRQYYLDGAPEILLHAICLADDGDVSCIITEDETQLHDAMAAVDIIDAACLERLANTLDASVISLARPLRLETIRVAKPWGAEIWYTGVEQRGICRVGNTPLPWLTHLAGELMHGNAPPELVLLKILDPLPDPVYGDLYFEMHDKKVEVYVVTHVDPSVWPGGSGGIRFGFNRELLAGHDSLAAFKRAYLQRVTEYGAIRRSIDAVFDRLRREEGIGEHDVVAPAMMERWKARIDPELNRLEQDARAKMDEFTQMHSLAVGDVVRVPPLTPHSLQHGVRVVEFQTPHYERYILSFAQKVLTQPHWDTTEALDKVDWESAFDCRLETIAECEQYRIDQVADFDAFEVHRIRLNAGCNHRLQLDTYAIVMAIEAAVTVGGMTLQPEEACLVPASMESVELSAPPSVDCLMLLAVPGPSP
jgi:hypothetical protein